MKKSLDNPEYKFSPSDMMTIEELRSFPGLENLSDKEALETVTSLYQLSQVALQVFLEEQKLKSSENGRSRSHS